MTEAGARESLRTRLARHVIVPLVATWAFGTVVVLGVSGHFAAQAFDRSLLDDAYALASNVKSEQGEIVLGLTPTELATLLFDQSESIYFAVIGPDGRLVAGQPGLRASVRLAPGVPAFADQVFEGKPLRAVTLQREKPGRFTVVMGQTTSTRTALLRNLLLYSALPQAALLLCLALWLRGRIQADVQPLADLERAIEQRGAHDLAPLPPDVRASATTRDIERIGAAVDGLLARLHDSISAQREFAGNAAHELRTPLAGIRAHAAFGLSQQDPSEWREQLLGIADAEKRASRLVDQLLALARAGEASAALLREKLDLNEVVRDIVLRFLPRADAAGVDLGAEGLDETVQVLADRALLEGIVGNLIDNAIRYGRGTPPNVTVKVFRDGAQAVVRVVDNGPGLGDVEPGQLLQRWMQGPAGQKLGQGAGLGLAIARRYAELSGGTLTLSPPPEGTTGLQAEFRLPAA